MPRPFPFSAIVGQEEMKLALRIAAVDPSVGGVLVFGDRGTGKSTAVRALAGLLPPIPVVEGCPYGCAPPEAGQTGSAGGGCPVCDGPAGGRAGEAGTGGRAGKGAGAGDSAAAAAAGKSGRNGTAPHGPAAGAGPAVVERDVPMVDLPLGATEDRVVGTLDLERALSDGVRAFEPGLLARANRGFLYIDEVNLLDDHLVDLLLDVAASGENVVEREGLSVRHPARFVLVGSGNPEEGDLRPQLLDRFGLSVEVATPRDIEMRLEVLRRRDAHDRDPEEFHRRWSGQDGRIRQQIRRARSSLDTVEVPDAFLRRASELCLALEVDGLRGELTLLRAARALAALEGRDRVTTTDLAEVAPPSLRHRLRRDPLDESGTTPRIHRALEETGIQEEAASEKARSA
ncbi:MAG: magnesium chelatase ATPase subunit I [Gemmatimonadales bacterium]|nr:MAG: magnesium chelatase ATPase subunit I [Gemmatimonadales bacterium]